jgi:hypothetical protein
MGFFNWLYRLPGRIDRSMEKTAVGVSVDSSEGTQVNPQSVETALGEMQQRGYGESGSQEGDSADAEG